MSPDDPVLAASTWQTNAHLIEDVVRLGHLKKSDRVLDPTFGRGIWWKNWRPDDLVTHDKYAVDGVDFRHVPHDDNEFDAVAFDPPYVCTGGKDTSGIKDLQNRYGIDRGPSTPAGVQELINAGLTEAKRVVKERGVILCKCQDYVSSGKLWLGTHHTLSHALELDLVCVDRLEHLGGVRPQPKHARQVHARRNLSTLFVFRKKPTGGRQSRSRKANPVAAGSISGNPMEQPERYLSGVTETDDE
jgi:hypothetical protein